MQGAPAQQGGPGAGQSFRPRPARGNARASPPTRRPRGSSKPQTNSGLDEWRSSIVRFLLESGENPVPMVTVGSEVARPASVGNTAKLSDVLKKDPHERFELNGEGISITVAIRRDKLAQAMQSLGDGAGRGDTVKPAQGASKKEPKAPKQPTVSKVR
jgi:hypothetical protein